MYNLSIFELGDKEGIGFKISHTKAEERKVVIYSLIALKKV